MDFKIEASVDLKSTNQFKKIFLDFSDSTLFDSSFYPYSNVESDYESIFQSYSGSNDKRNLLISVLKNQYGTLLINSDRVYQNIETLRLSNTYTVCTGHQLSLLGGPLFLFSKIISVINRCEELKLIFPGKEFVPVFWMASEDHDIEEINHLFIDSEKLEWNTTQQGKSGNLNLQGLSEVIELVRLKLKDSANNEKAIELLEKAKNNSNNLSEFTRCFLHQLFGKYGLVVVDGDDINLKKSFSSIIKEDIINQWSYKKVSETIKDLESVGYSTQVFPREINFFYCTDNNRNRLVYEENKYKVLNTDLEIDTSLFSKWLEDSIEKISPNVVTRPLYQQFILPNVEYIGGPGEIAYWLEYGKMFAHYSIPYPVINPRDFVLLIDKKQVEKVQGLPLGFSDYFLPIDDLNKCYLMKSSLSFSLEDEIGRLEKIKYDLKNRIGNIDTTLVNSVESNFQKFYTILDQLKGKSNKAIKVKEEVQLNKINSFRNKILPTNQLMERVEAALVFLAKDIEVVDKLKILLQENKKKGMVILISYH